jgi:hypothetical protein
MYFVPTPSAEGKLRFHRPLHILRTFAGGQRNEVHTANETGVGTPVGGRRDRLGNRVRKRLMGLTGGVGMDTLVTIILVDVTIYASRRTHCQLPVGPSGDR